MNVRARAKRHDALHETAFGRDVIEGPSDRAFGLTVGGILFAIAGVGHVFWGWEAALAGLLMGLGAALAALAVTAPKLLAPLNFLWTKLGLLLGLVMTPVVMLAIFALVFVPFGLTMRARGYDPLRRNRPVAGASYWIARDPPGPNPVTMADQF